MGSLSESRPPAISNRADTVTGFTLPLSRIPKQGSASQLDGGQKDYGQVQLQSVDEYSYLLPLSVGNQQFETIFDTGSSDLWIISTACTSEDCQRVNRYSPTPSLALANVPFNLNYLTGAVAGVIGYETVAFGPYVVFSQALALADNATDMGLSSTGVSGVLGFAFPSDAAISMTIGRTLLDNVFASLNPQERFFSYKLSGDSFSSSFSVGQINPLYSNRLPEVMYSPVFAPAGSDYDYWKLPLLSLSVNSVSIPFALSPSKVRGSSSPIAVLDSGTTLILGPSHDVDNFWTVAGSAQKGDDGRWQVRCEHAVTVGFLLGNDSSRQEIILDPSDVSWMPAGSRPADGWCLGGIQSNDGVFSGDWLLGDIFLRNAYVIHQAAVASSPPLIGLLGTTNVSETLEQFQTSRGNDSSAPPSYASLFTHRSTPPKPAAIFAATLILSFLGGAGMTLLFRTRREIRSKRP